MALTSKTQLLEYLQVKSIKECTDSFVEWLIKTVEQHIKNRTGRNQLESGAVTEYHDGDGVTGYFFTNEFPITAVTSLHDDPVHPHTYAAGYLISTDDYEWYGDGRIELVTGTFNAGLKNIKVVYTAGYATVPKDLEYLATKWVAMAIKGKDRIGISSQSGADGSVTVFNSFLDPDMMAILNQYSSLTFKR